MTRKHGIAFPTFPVVLAAARIRSSYQQLFTASRSLYFGKYTGKMQSSAFQHIRDGLVRAEAEYMAASKQNRGLHKVLQVLEKMYDSRQERVDRDESTEPIDRLIASTEEKFSEVLQDALAGELDESLDLSVWAHDLQGKVRLLDPFLLSFDSDDSQHASPYEGASTYRNIKTASKSSVMRFLRNDGKLVENMEGSSQRRVKRVNNLTVVAWLFAVLALLVTVGFLTADFVVSQQNPAIRIEQVPSETMDLPAVSVCNPVEGLPTFHDFPTDKYPGHPLFVFTQLRNYNDNTTTENMASGVEITYVGSDLAKCERDTSVMSVDRQRQALFRYSFTADEEVIGVDEVDAAPCLTCYRFGAEKRLQTRASTASASLQHAVVATLSISRVFSYCRYGVERTHFDQAAKSFLVQQLILHSSELASHGTLDFSGFDTPQLRRSRLVMLSEQPEHPDILCNIYFFAGYFYPSADNGKVSYKYINENITWVHTGSKEYTYRTWPIEATSSFFHDSDAAGQDLSTATGLEVFFGDPREVQQRRLLRPSEISSTVHDSGFSSFLLERRGLENGKFGYGFKRHTVSQEHGWSQRYSKAHIGFEYGLHATSEVVLQPTMSWAEYVTDVFEFIGLFTGVCIFSLIVAPAQTLV